MKSMLKTTLLASSVALALSATAGDFNEVTEDHSKQGLAALASTATVTVSGVTYTLGAAYAEGDQLTLSVTAGALADSYSWPTSLVSTAGTGGGTAEFGLLNSTDDSATYRVTTVTASSGQTTINAVVTVGDFVLNPSAISAGSVSVSASAVASNGVTVIDSSGDTSEVLAESSDQFTDFEITTAADQVIDVAGERKVYESGLTDTVVWEFANDTTLVNAATATGAEVTLNGTFTGLEASAFSTGATSTVALNEEETEVTFTYTSALTTDTITITPPTGDDAVVLAAQSFALDAEVTYGTDSSLVLATNEDAGEWTLNGAMVNVPYMPYGANISQILFVTNTGAQVGDIIVTAIDEAGMTHDLGTVATASANSVTKITAQVKDALEAAGLTTGKVALTVTVNAPEEDITVYASYNVGGSDRGFVNTDQYKGQ